MFDLQKYLRYEVLNKDKCSSLLKPQDISLQKIFIDGRKQEKWVFVAKLDSTSEDGYLKSELPHCKALPYLPSTNLEIKPYLDIDEALVQKFPSFRVQLPYNVAVAKIHTDNSLGHPFGEINFTYTFTEMKDTTSILIEKMPTFNEFTKIEADENSIVSFNANLCRHYNEVNKTGKTRMSMDFRILPLNYKPQDDGFSHTSNKKFVDGGYYKLLKQVKKI